MHWRAFEEAAPELAQLARERFARTGVALLGTLRRDGSPRISPIEPLVAGDALLLGMLWRSTKALDLLRDPRCTLHSAVTRLDGDEGECKLDGRAMEATDPAVRARYEEAFRAHWGDQAPARFHVFALDVARAAFIAYDTTAGEMLVKRWDPQHGLREARRPYP
jgi:hypothetical protein